MKQYLPTLTKVLVKPSEVPEKTKSGFYVPDTAKDTSSTGKVVAVGEGKPEEPMTIKVGDDVIMDDMRKRDIKLEEEKYILIEQDHILLITNRNEND